MPFSATNHLILQQGTIYMRQLSRPTALKIAAAFMVMLSLIDITVYQIPSLISGEFLIDPAVNEGPPFFMVILAFTVDIVALVAAYGAWNQQRWGVVLLIVTAALTTLPSLGGMIFAPDRNTRIIGAIGILSSAIVITLCLWREQRASSRDDMH